jgi:hypothetical protein
LVIFESEIWASYWELDLPIQVILMRRINSSVTDPTASTPQHAEFHVSHVTFFNMHLKEG